MQGLQTFQRKRLSKNRWSISEYRLEWGERFWLRNCRIQQSWNPPKVEFLCWWETSNWVSRSCLEKYWRCCLRLRMEKGLILAYWSLFKSIFRNQAHDSNGLDHRNKKEVFNSWINLFEQLLASHSIKNVFFELGKFRQGSSTMEHHQFVTQTNSSRELGIQTSYKLALHSAKPLQAYLIPMYPQSRLPLSLTLQLDPPLPPPLLLIFGFKFKFSCIKTC